MVEGDLVGAVLDGRYRVVEAIGRGAMGIVYRGERLHLGRIVAIKVLHDSLPDELSGRQRFELEARAMARLEHPHCVAVLDVGLHDNRPYVVMEMVTGVSLRTLLDRGPLDVARATAIIRQVLSGLAHAHELGIIHRDIKPANLMLGHKTGLGDQVKILDFGLVRSLDSTSTRLTTNIVLGTPSYMAPEQCRDSAVDARSDLYACGVLLFEMLTGKKPFESAKDDPMEVVGMQLHKPPPRLADILPSVDFGGLEVVVARALEKQPADRFATAAAFADAVDAAVRGETEPVAHIEPETMELDIAAAMTDGRGEATKAGWDVVPAVTKALSGADADPSPRRLGTRSGGTHPPTPDPAARRSSQELAATEPAKIEPVTASPATMTLARAKPAAEIVDTVPAAALDTVPSLRPSAEEVAGEPAPADDHASPSQPTVPARVRRDATPPPPEPSPRGDATWGLPAPRDAAVTDPMAARRRRLVIALVGALGALVVVAIAARACSGGGTSSSAADASLAIHTPPPTADAREVVGDAAAPAPDAAPAIDAPVDTALASESDDPAGAALQRAAERVSANDIDGALQILGKAHAAYVANPDIPWMAGRLYFEKQRYRQGLVSFRAALALFPGYLDDPELPKLAVQAFLATPTRDASLALFLHNDLGKTAIPFLREAAATNPRAAAELKRF